MNFWLFAGIFVCWSIGFVFAITLGLAAKLGDRLLAEMHEDEQ